MTGDRSTKKASSRTARKIHTDRASFKLDLPSLTTLAAIRATTAALMPANACWTTGITANLDRKAAIKVMMTREGKTRPRLDTLVKLAHLYQVSIDYLLGVCDER